MLAGREAIGGRVMSNQNSHTLATSTAQAKTATMRSAKAALVVKRELIVAIDSISKVTYRCEAYRVQHYTLPEPAIVFAQVATERKGSQTVL